ncbi:MAG: glutamyl-tRNA reductase [Candidatus Azotimanducaceae bacterium]|jgi:glutamyl-tRNA reductase
MNLLIVGINHNSAPVELREKVAFTPEQMGDALAKITEGANLAEVAILSTCNRTEIIAASSNIDPTSIIRWLEEYHRIPPNSLDDIIYTFTQRGALKHAMRVACGLDSMVVGEPQILGQFKECFDMARQHDTLGSELDQMSQSAFRVAKKVRTDTAIGKNSVSVASTAVTLAQHLFSDLTQCQILLIGAGETTQLVGRHLVSAGIKDITIANRTIANARTLAAEFNASAIDLQTIPQALADTDVVIAATSAQLPILGKGTVESALRTRKHRPILMVDLAVPRDIEPEVGELKDIYLYSVDDLQEMINHNMKNRQEAAEQAEEMISEVAANYRTHHENRAIDQTIARFREHHNAIKEQELEKAMARLSKGEAPAQVLNQLANQLTNKIIHSPSVALRKAAEEGEGQLLDVVNDLYQLNRSKDRE